MGRRVLKSYSTVKTENPKFEKYLGLPQFSYSAYTSWKTEAYIGSFIASKFLGIEDTGNIFTDFGSACGEYLETRDTDSPIRSPLLSDKDIEVLDSVDLPEGSEFEREIMLKREIDKRGEYCIIGFIDMATPEPDARISVKDFKTGSAKKAAEYGGPDYKQTRLYSYALEKEEGEEIAYVGVELLHRKGNNVVPGDKNVLRLEGTIEQVETPYTSEEAEEFLKDFDKVAMEISDYLTFYEKYFLD